MASNSASRPRLTLNCQTIATIHIPLYVLCGRKSIPPPGPLSRRLPAAHESTVVTTRPPRKFAIASAGLAILAVLASAASPVAANERCLSYGPEVVSVRGRLVRRIFYGAPGFGEDPRHDAKEAGFYLELSAPACTVAGADEIDRARDNIRLVQLVLDAAGYARLRPFLGRRVTLRGTLFGAVTAYHHTPVLLDGLKPISVGQWVGRYLSVPSIRSRATPRGSTHTGTCPQCCFRTHFVC